MLSILAPPFNADEAWLRPKSVSPDGLRNNWNQQLLLAVERRPVPSERRDAQLDQHGTDVAVLVSIEAFERAGSMVCNCRLCSALFGVWPMSCIRSMCRWTFTELDFAPRPRPAFDTGLDFAHRSPPIMQPGQDKRRSSR